MTSTSSNAGAPTAPALPNAVLAAAQQLTAQGGGRTSLVIRLDPPDLGAVLVRLTVRNDKVSLRVTTADGTAVAGVGATADDLRRTLAGHGLSLDRFDVQQGGLTDGRNEKQSGENPFGESLFGQHEAGQDRAPARAYGLAQRADPTDVPGGPRRSGQTTTAGRPGTWL